MASKRIKLSHIQDEFAACDTWLSTTERKNVTSFILLCAGDIDPAAGPITRPVCRKTAPAAPFAPAPNIRLLPFNAPARVDAAAQPRSRPIAVNDLRPAKLL